MQASLLKINAYKFQQAFQTVEILMRIAIFAAVVVTSVNRSYSKKKKKNTHCHPQRRKRPRLNPLLMYTLLNVIFHSAENKKNNAFKTSWFYFTSTQVPCAIQLLSLNPFETSIQFFILYS